MLSRVELQQLELRNEIAIETSDNMSNNRLQLTIFVLIQYIKCHMVVNSEALGHCMYIAKT